MGYPAAPTLRLYFTPLHFILQSPDVGVLAQLILERNTGRCYCTENFNPFENGVNDDELYYLDIFSILGVIVIDSVLYLTVTTDADIIGSIHNSNIYEIKGTELIPFVPNTIEPETQASEKDNISKLFTSGFYFSYYYDLTRSMQNSSNQENLHSRADKSFYWNLELYRDLILQGVDTQWLIPVIQGFISVQQTVCKENNITLILISRRSCDRTGTRYNCRGVDDEGNVANFVETEQILITNNNYFSYVQVRGSVPIYWEQTGITAQLSLTKSQESSAEAFKKHIGSLLQKYSHVTLINLLQEAKTHEKLLSTEWETIFKQSIQNFNSRVVYQYYDFHANCKGQRYSSINELTKCLQDYSNYYKYYSENQTTIEFKQKGVMRTNCLDCLDRTNVVQSYIAWTVICDMLQTLQIDLKVKLDSINSLPIIKVFKNMWADNGDVLSYQYTGTGSTISSITRGEKQGLKTLISQSLKSIGRFYNANLNDAAKQKSIDAVLRRRKDSSQLNRIETEVFSRESEYTKFIKYRIRCVTWNLGGNKLPYDYDISSIIFGSHFSDVLIFSFQEVVKLNAKNVLMEKSNSKRIRRIKFIIADILNIADYSLICENSLVGVLLLIYCKNSVCPHMYNIETDALRLGFGGKMGNKGAVVGRFTLEDTNLCIISCHLASGTSQSELRKSQIRDIQADIFVKEKTDRRQMQIFEHDYKFVCGDLNFRIDLPGALVRQMVSENKISELLEHDQLTQTLSQGTMPGYKEPGITFKPTYKFDKKTDVYDTSKKLRPPAWCDRVLYNGDLEIVSYSSVDLRISDHRPVFGEFLIKCKRIDIDKKLEITEKLLKEISEQDLLY
jgi:synaptojanin